MGILMVYLLTWAWNRGSKKYIKTFVILLLLVNKLLNAKLLLNKSVAFVDLLCGYNKWIHLHYLKPGHGLPIRTQLLPPHRLLYSIGNGNWTDQ